MSQSVQTDSLWDYAVAAYQRPGVAEACLALQDNGGADVNLLLAAAWLAERGCGWSSDDVARLAHLCAGWRTRCLLPLRQVRRYLKEQMEIDDLYRRVKALELEAERYQLRLIEETVRHLPLQASAVGATGLLAANLEISLQALPQLRARDYRGELQRLVQALSVKQ